MTITQRCRQRLKWAQEEDLSSGSEDWVCTNEKCARVVCQAYHMYRSSMEEHGAAQRLVGETRIALQQAEDDLGAARNELRQVQSDFEQDQSQRQQGSNEHTIRLLDTIVRYKETVVRDKETIVRHIETIVRDKKSIVRDKKTILQKICKDVLRAHETMKEVLINGKAAGNKTDHKTEYTNAPQIQKELEEMDLSQKEHKQESDTGHGRVPSPSKLSAALQENITDHDIPQELRLKEATQKEVADFYSFCNRGFLNSIVIPQDIAYDSADFLKCIVETCSAITGWKSGQKHAKEPFYRPRAVGEETRAVHPILFAVMWKLNAILSGTAHLTHEQYLPPQEEKSKRWVDGMLWESAQAFVHRADGSLMGDSVEIKPISRKSGPFTKMIEEGSNQTLGHILEVLWDACYQFCGGLGRNGTAGGVVLTMISFKFFRGDLMGVGTDPQLQIHISKNQPLFPKETTAKLAAESKVEVKDLGLAFGEEDMQPGFVSLMNFLHDCNQKRTALNYNGSQSKAELEVDAKTGGVATDNDRQSEATLLDVKTGNKITLQEYLGSGAFSSVYYAMVETQDGPTTSVILKCGKSLQVSTDALRNEIMALKAVDHASIPKLWQEELVEMTVKQRCERNKIRALMLQMDRGKSLREIYKKQIKLCPEDVQRILQSVKAALEHAHAKSWYHLDVQPSNIVQIKRGNHEDQYFLIDWGTAAYGGPVNERANPKYQLTSYRGTPPFSHPDMLQRTTNDKDGKWTPKFPDPEFDYFSLVMTICYVMGNGVSWTGFNSKRVTESMIEERQQQANDLISKGCLDDSTKEWLMKSLWSTIDSRKQKPSQKQPPKASSSSSKPVPHKRKRASLSSQGAQERKSSHHKRKKQA